jgi:nucleobase:cation symporter-1, NCS1 family
MADSIAPDDEQPTTPPGPRRATYTPPPAHAQYPTGAVADPAPERPAVSEPSTWQVEGTLDALAAADAATGATTTIERSASAASSSSSSLPPPPTRSSLSDSELAAVLDPSLAPPGSTAELIELFEEQLSLRADEADRLARWENEVRGSGLPDAEQLVRSVRSAFTGIVDIVPAAPPADPWAEYPVSDPAVVASADNAEPVAVPPLVEPRQEPPVTVAAVSPDEPAPLTTASGPVLAVAVADTDSPTTPPALRVEASALEPTPVVVRAGRSIRLFWLWFAVNSSVLTIGLGAVLIGFGMSLRQAILATLVGVVLSFLPLGLGTLAGKWSGQPTMVVSRASFGIVGNLIPALLATVSRAVWAAILLAIVGAGVSSVLLTSGLVTGVEPRLLSIGIASGALVVAALIAGFGFGMVAVVAAITSVVAAILAVGAIVVTLPIVSTETALAIPDGDWVLVLTGSVLVFSVIGLGWANSSGDLARYQAKGTISAGAVLFTSIGATLAPMLLIGWGAVLASSDPALRDALGSDPVAALVRLLPPELAVPLAVAIGLSLVVAASLALYSGGFAILTLGVRTSRPVSVLLSVLLAASLAAPLVSGMIPLDALLRDVLITLAVPIAAWAGIFGAETMIRTCRVHSPSLLQSGGVYPAVRWINTLMLLVATAAGWGLTTASLDALSWQGYLWPAMGVPTVVSESDLGVLVALVLGLLTPLVAGVRSLRRLQEAEFAASRSS